MLIAREATATIVTREHRQNRKDNLPVDDSWFLFPHGNIEVLGHETDVPMLTVR